MNEREGQDPSLEKKADSSADGSISDDEARMNPHPKKPQSSDTSRQDLPEVMASLCAEVSRIASCTVGVRTELRALRDEIAQLKTEKQALTHLSDRCRELTERFHEREVLYPILFTLMTIADRARQEVARLRRLMNEQSGKIGLEGLIIMRHLIEARNADRIRVEDVLASYGVQPYQEQGEVFNASCQNLAQSVACDKPELHGRIASRLSFGYRRNGEILRPERVKVYRQNPVQNEEMIR